MDLILAYDDESESNSENETDERHDVDVLPSKVKPASAVPIDSQAETDALVSQSSTSNFFNLAVFQPNPPKSNPKASYNTKKDSGDEVDIPDGEFWSDFIPEEDPCSKDCQQAPRTSHEEYFKRQTMSDNNFNNLQPSCHESKQNLIIPFNSKSQSRVHSVRHACHPYLATEGNRNVSFADMHRTASHTHKPNDHIPNQASAVQSPEKRKVYYIHSKVAPYLHTNCVCKPASKASASWLAHEGAANRLNWNMPNYSHLLVTAGMDSKISVWSVWSSIDQCVATFACHTKAVRHVEWCHSGRAVFSCSFDRTAQITDVESGKSKAKFDHIGYVTAGSTHSSNPNLFATGTDNMIFLWDSRTPQAPTKHFAYKEAFGQVQDITFIADGRELVSCGDLVARDSADRSIMVWDVRSGAILSNQVFQERYTCTRLKLHKDKSHFLAQTHGGYVALFSASAPYKMEKSKRFGGHKLLGYHIGFDTSPDGKLVYSGSAEGGVHVYDYRTGKCIRKLTTSCDDVVMDVACHPILPSVLATCTWGGTVKLWQ